MTTLSAGPRIPDLAPRPGRDAPRLVQPPQHDGGRTASAGRLRYDLRADQWWWSPGLFDLHGVAPGSVEPGAALLLRGIHPDDRAQVRQALGGACAAGTPFAVRHRICRMDGTVRTAVLVGDLETGPDGAATALNGLVVEVTDEQLDAATGDHLRHLETEIEQLRTAMASRATIEQAKGVLMLLMGCGEQVAFDLLTHISSHTHRKARDVAAAIVGSAGSGTALPADVRSILHDACPPGAPAV